MENLAVHKESGLGAELQNDIHTVDTQQYFLDILKSFINQTEPPINCNVDWEQLYELSKKHSLGGALGYMAEKLDDANKPSEEIRQQISVQYISTVAFSAQKEYGMQMLVEQLKSQNIHHLFVKGAILRDYYPVKELRTFGDVDFYIHYEDRQKCHELMLSLGCKCRYSDGGISIYILNHDVYEIHSGQVPTLSPNKDDDFFQDAWDYAIPYGKKPTFTFSPVYHLLYILQCISKRMYNKGAGIRMFMDVAVFVRHFDGKLNWELLFHELKKIGLDVFAYRVFALCRSWFGIRFSFKIPALKKQFRQEILYYVMSAEISGYGVRKLSYHKTHKDFVRKPKASKSVRFKSVISFLFPPYSTMKSKYSFVNGRPYILPLGWAARAFKVFTPLRKAAFHRLRDISNGVEGAFENYELLRQFGLYQS